VNELYGRLPETKLEQVQRRDNPGQQQS
jgi:hypothetical protein